MILSKEPLKTSDMQEGMGVYLKKDNAEYFSERFRLSDDPDTKNYTYPEGKYRITKIENQENSSKIPEPARVTKIVICHHNEWKDTDNGLLIAYNNYSQAICAGAILISDALYAVVETSKDLDKINENRTTCGCCGKDLNIISPRVRFCKSCEDLLQFEEPEDMPEEVDDIFDTLEIDLDAILKP